MYLFLISFHKLSSWKNLRRFEAYIYRQIRSVLLHSILIFSRWICMKFTHCTRFVSFPIYYRKLRLNWFRKYIRQNPNVDVSQYMSNESWSAKFRFSTPKIISFQFRVNMDVRTRYMCVAWNANFFFKCHFRRRCALYARIGT